MYGVLQNIIVDYLLIAHQSLITVEINKSSTVRTSIIHKKEMEYSTPSPTSNFPRLLLHLV